MKNNNEMRINGYYKEGFWHYNLNGKRIAEGKGLPAYCEKYKEYKAKGYTVKQHNTYI